MDPDAALKELRECLEDNDGPAGSTRPPDLDRAKELFHALDQWLCTGGFLPKDWEKSWNHTTGL